MSPAAEVERMIADLHSVASAIDRALDADGVNMIGSKNIERLKAARGSARAIATSLVLQLSDETTPQQVRSTTSTARAFLYSFVVLVAAVTSGIADAPDAIHNLIEVASSVDEPDAATPGEEPNPSNRASWRAPSERWVRAQEVIVVPPEVEWNQRTNRFMGPVEFMPPAGLLSNVELTFELDEAGEFFSAKPGPRWRHDSKDTHVLTYDPV